MMDKATVGDGKKDSVFSVIMRDFGANHAVQAMNRLAKLSARWLTNQGFSIGISDVTPGSQLVSEKQKLVAEAYAIILGRDTRSPRSIAPCIVGDTRLETGNDIIIEVRQDASSKSLANEGSNKDTRLEGTNALEHSS